MYSLKNLIQASPARLVSLLMAVIVLAGIYGLDIGPDDPDKFATSVFLILTILGGGELTRSQVYSPATVKRIRGG